MAYGLTGIDSVEAWVCASEYADDGSLDADVSACMLNGTNGEDCDEWKEGTLNGKVILDLDPASIISLSVRFYFNSVMTAGDNDLVPYTDANSVSSTNAITKDYTTPGAWVEHVCTGAFIAELGDIGGGQCAVRLCSPGGAKTKVGEVNIDYTIYTLTLAGITRDAAGDALVSCEYQIFKRTGLAPETWSLVESGISNGSTGAYTHERGRATYRVVSLKDVEPQVQYLGPPIIGAQAEADDDIFTLGTYSNLANDDQVWIYQCGVAALPTGVSEDTLYYVVSYTANTCKLSLTQGGGAINITVDGDCWIVGKPATS